MTELRRVVERARAELRASARAEHLDTALCLEILNDLAKVGYDADKEMHNLKLEIAELRTKIISMMRLIRSINQSSDEHLTLSQSIKLTLMTLIGADKDARDDLFKIMREHKHPDKDINRLADKVTEEIIVEGLVAHDLDVQEAQSKVQ